MEILQVWDNINSTTFTTKDGNFNNKCLFLNARSRNIKKKSQPYTNFEELKMDQM